MLLKVKSNGLEVELSSELYNGLSEDQKLSYEVLDKADAKEEKPKKDEVVSNKNETPPSGNKK